MVFYKYATLFNSFETSEYLQDNWVTNHCNGTIPSVFWYCLRSTQEFDVFWVFFVSLHSNDHIIITANTDWVFFDVPLVSSVPLVSCLPKMLGERPWKNLLPCIFLFSKFVLSSFSPFQIPNWWMSLSSVLALVDFDQWCVKLIFNQFDTPLLTTTIPTISFRTIGLHFRGLWFTSLSERGGWQIKRKHIFNIGVVKQSYFDLF